MRNRIIGILIVLTSVVILFTGSAAIGSISLPRAPRIINIITHAPDGSPYNAKNLVTEIAIDFCPVLWIPEVIAGTIQPDPTFGLSTFSKVPRILRTMEGNYDPDLCTLVFDCTAISPSALGSGSIADPSFYLTVARLDDNFWTEVTIKAGQIGSITIPVGSTIRVTYNGIYVGSEVITNFSCTLSTQSPSFSRQVYSVPFRGYFYQSLYHYVDTRLPLHPTADAIFYVELTHY